MHLMYKNIDKFNISNIDILVNLSSNSFSPKCCWLWAWLQV